MVTSPLPAQERQQPPSHPSHSQVATRKDPICNLQTLTLLRDLGGWGRGAQSFPSCSSSQTPPNPVVGKHQRHLPHTSHPGGLTGAQGLRQVAV